jgi:hypothetical protein
MLTIICTRANCRRSLRQLQAQLSVRSQKGVPCHASPAPVPRLNVSRGPIVSAHRGPASTASTPVPSIAGFALSLS